MARSGDLCGQGCEHAVEAGGVRAGVCPRLGGPPVIVSGMGVGRRGCLGRAGRWGRGHNGVWMPSSSQTAGNPAAVVAVLGGGVDHGIEQVPVLALKSSVDLAEKEESSSVGEWIVG
jgi:hypothetical protein